MTRPTPDSSHPYTRSQAAILTGASAPQVKKLSTKLLKKKGRGTGNHLGYNLDELLRISLAKELLRVGVQVGAMHSLFASIEKDWPRLRSPVVHVEGACLVIFIGALGPNSATGRAYLTTTKRAVEWLQQKKQTVIVIDVAALINQLEERTGERYV